MKIVQRQFLVLLAFLLTGFVGGIIATSFSLPPYLDVLSHPSQIATSSGTSLSNLVEKSSRGVVSITSTTGDEKTFGTGFVVSSEGLIITCAHVVKDSNMSYEITTQDNKTYPVQVVSRHAREDIAFLKADASNMPTLKLGDSNSLKTGQEIIAIGNPFGLLDGTVTTGIVSGIHRDIIALDQDNKYQEGLHDVIQIDASLNPGESGGPLLNMSGEVVGVNAASDTRAQNISFAIPVNVIKQIGIMDNMHLGFLFQ